MGEDYLTLTSVVFEFEIVLIFYKRLWHLTLTSVVFEFVEYNALHLVF